MTDTDTLREALEPFAELEIPKKPEGNAGFYSIPFGRIIKAQTALATLSKPEPPSGIADLRDRLRNSIEALGEDGIGSNVSMSYEFANDLLDALSKPEPDAVGEAVAWMYDTDKATEIFMFQCPSYVKQGWTEIPLYASPVPSGGADEKAIRHDERKKIIAQGCIHTRKAGENADYDRPDVSQWQHDQSEYFDPTILEIVSEYAAWRDSQPSPSEAISPPDARAVVEAADKIDQQADCLDHYAEMSGFKKGPLPSVFHLQSSHFRDIAKELRAALQSGASK